MIYLKSLSWTDRKNLTITQEKKHAKLDRK